MSLTGTTECVIPINNNTAEICEYMSTYCTEWQNLYLRYYYCSAVIHPILSNLLFWVFVIFIIGLLFFILGILASDYLVPNLSALSDALKMDEKLSGLTLLAFANGSPDILSTFIAMKQGMTSMAVGELLGSANFSLTVVIGVIAIYKPFKVNQTTFMRDLIIFSLLILLSLYILSDGVITIVESIILCLLYVIFILFNVFLPSDEYNKEEQQEAEIIEEHNVDIENRAGDNRDNWSAVSADSRGSSVSMNDYYFAHNIDNLEQGRGYKIALLDSLKLAWLYQRKSVYNKTPQNEIGQLVSIEAVSSPESPVAGDSTELLIPLADSNVGMDGNKDENLEDVNEVVAKAQKHILKSPDIGSSPPLSRSTSARKLKNKRDYQILYPSRSAMPSTTNSLINFNVDAETSLKSNDNPIIPQIIEPEEVEYPSTNIENTEAINRKYCQYGNKVLLNESLHHDTDKLDLLQKLEPTEHRGPSFHRSSLDLQVLQSVPYKTATMSSLIPYVEYNRTPSMLKKIIPLEIFTGALSIEEKIISVFVVLLSSVFNIIIPVSLPGELKGEIYDHELSMSAKLFHFQIGLLPLLLFDFDLCPLVLFTVVLLPIISVGIRYILSKEHYQAVFPPLLALVGFFSVLKLITVAASAVISVLKDLAKMFSLNESILGLTILSLGNSVGDVVTNLALAALGRPLTGLHACFGSPLLYILFGVGNCSLIVQLSSSHSKTIEFAVDASLKLTAVSIVTMLIIYSICLPLNGWIFKRWVGYFSVFMWFLVTTVNFVLHRHR